MVEILHWVRCVTGSQCRLWKIGWIWSDFLAFHTSRAAAFRTCWSLSRDIEGNPRVGSYNNLNEREQESKRRVWVAWVVRRCRVERLYLICMYADLQVLFMCCDVLRFESRVTPRFFTEDTNGTSASPMWMSDGKEVWVDILFESVIMASVFVSFNWSLFLATQDLTSVLQFCRVSIDWWISSSVLTLESWLSSANAWWLTMCVFTLSNSGWV